MHKQLSRLWPLIPVTMGLLVPARVVAASEAPPELMFVYTTSALRLITELEGGGVHGQGKGGANGYGSV